MLSRSFTHTSTRNFTTSRNCNSQMRRHFFTNKNGGVSMPTKMSGYVLQNRQNASRSTVKLNKEIKLLNKQIKTLIGSQLTYQTVFPAANHIASKNLDSHFSVPVIEPKLEITKDSKEKGIEMSNIPYIINQTQSEIEWKLYLDTLNLHELNTTKEQFGKMKLKEELPFSMKPLVTLSFVPPTLIMLFDFAGSTIVGGGTSFDIIYIPWFAGGALASFIGALVNDDMYGKYNGKQDWYDKVMNYIEYVKKTKHKNGN